MADRPLEHLDWIALMDQVDAEARDSAKLLRSYYEALLDTGFTRGESMLLTANFQKQLMTPPPGETPDPDRPPGKPW